MNLMLQRYPATIIFCIIWSVIATFFVIIDIHHLLRTLFSIPMIIFIPGYLLVYVLFPEKTEKVFDIIDRIALGVGISIAIVPLFGLIYFHSRWSFAVLQPIFITLEIFILILGFIAIIRWYRTPDEKRYIPNITLPRIKDETLFDKTLTLILIICILIAASLAIYAVLIPKPEERFTSFYVLASDHQAYNYPMNLSVGENVTVILGVVNHEQTTMNYFIEVWLSNQTTTFNTSSNRNETIYHNLWFFDKLSIQLPHQPINLVDMVTSQWEYNYTFNITKKGTYKLVFLLDTTEVYQYSKNQDYQFLALEKLDNDHTTAYRDLYLWINVE